MQKKAAEFISKNSANGAYASISNPLEFAAKLTEDVVSVSHDKHFRIFYEPEWILARKRTTTKEDSLKIVNNDVALWRRDNFGFKEVKILEGNIGYLNLQGFCDPKYAGETAIAAMNFLSNTDAIIFDFRTNHGGESTMVQFLFSYFVEPPVLLFDMYAREGNRHIQDWALPYVPGKRRTAIDIYILTSNYTFSGAEAFSYRLKNLKRATIVGEVTGGGANMWQKKTVNDRFTVDIPTERPIDPITKTNWEGSGVQPDIKVPAKDALITAHIMAIEKLAATSADSGRYLWHLPSLKAKQKPVDINLSTLKLFVGDYGTKKLRLENGKLVYYNADLKYELSPIGPYLFKVEELEYLKLKMVFENNKVTAIVQLYDNGSSRTFIKNKN